jgi:hypothetical protein
MAQRSASPAPLAKEDKDAADAPTVSQKKKHAKKARQERRDEADGQNGSQKEEHADKQKDTRTEATAASENKKTENVREGGTGELPPFKDLKSVSAYDDEDFIRKLAEQSFISCILFSAGSEGMRCARLGNALRSFIARVLLFRWIALSA